MASQPSLALITDLINQAHACELVRECAPLLAFIYDHRPRQPAKPHPAPIAKRGHTGSRVVQQTKTRPRGEAGQLQEQQPCP